MTKMIECEICHKQFKNQHSLSQHMYKYHRDISSQNDSNTEMNTNANSENITIPSNNDDKINDKNESPTTDNDKNGQNNDTITIGEAPFSTDDLNRAKNDLPEGADEMIKIVENMTEEDGKELYLIMIEGFGDINGVDIETEMPEMVKKAERRGKHLSYTVNRFMPQIREYIVPIMLVGGIGLDFLAIRKVGQAKKIMQKLKNDKNDNDKNEGVQK